MKLKLLAKNIKLEYDEIVVVTRHRGRGFRHPEPGVYFYNKKECIASIDFNNFAICEGDNITITDLEGKITFDNKDV